MKIYKVFYNKLICLDYIQLSLKQTFEYDSTKNIYIMGRIMYKKRSVKII